MCGDGNWKFEIGIWKLGFGISKLGFTPEVAIAEADLKLVENHPFAAIAPTGVNHPSQPDIFGKFWQIPISNSQIPNSKLFQIPNPKSKFPISPPARQPEISYATILKTKHLNSF
jgi:hypothetical protein